MKYFTTILTILGIYLFVYACSEKPCTDDGCPDFYKEEPELTAMEKFFDCLGDSSKCKDIKNNDNWKN